MTPLTEALTKRIRVQEQKLATSPVGNKQGVVWATRLSVLREDLELVKQFEAKEKEWKRELKERIKEERDSMKRVVDPHWVQAFDWVLSRIDEIEAETEKRRTIPSRLTDRTS